MTTSTDTKPADSRHRFERFPELSAIPWLRHVFVIRQPDISLSEKRDQCLKNLRDRHRQILEHHAIPAREMATVRQVHGPTVAWIADKPQLPIPDADGLATSTAGLPLGIYVADCCAIYLVDLKNKAIALLHSGLKGTHSNIAREGIKSLEKHAGSDASSLLAVLSPCIRGCCYREEFADNIVRQLSGEGVSQIFRYDTCTACRPDDYYSYHREKGRTGRMLATMMIASL